RCPVDPGRQRVARRPGRRDQRASRDGRDDLMAAGSRAPARAWLRPALVLAGGAAATTLLYLADQLIVAVPAALFTLLMVYWTSPLRTGDHTAMSTARTRRGDEVAIILWAPGNPLSARMQTAIRGEREDVVWVNVFRDSEAADFAAEYGGQAALPLLIVGSEVTAAATVGELLDMQ